jgi:hypothetical protein
VSCIAVLSPEEQQRVITELEDLIARTPELAGKAEVAFPHDTYCYTCRKTG